MSYGTTSAEFALYLFAGLLGIVGAGATYVLFTEGANRVGLPAVCGLFLLASGYYGYAWAAPEWQMARSWLGMMAAAVSAEVAHRVRVVQAVYYSSQAFMIWGAFLFLAAFYVKVRRPR